MKWTDWDNALTALCAWREARGEGSVGMKAVMSVVRNRAQLHRISPAQVAMAPKQFSSMTFPTDPMLIQFPRSDDPQFVYCMTTVEDVLNGNLVDPTGGATHYFNPNIVMPEWAKAFKKLYSIGHHDFYLDPKDSVTPHSPDRRTD